MNVKEKQKWSLLCSYERREASFPLDYTNADPKQDQHITNVLYFINSLISYLVNVNSNWLVFFFRKNMTS